MQSPLRASHGASTSSTPAPRPPAGATTASNGVVLPGHGDLWSSILDSVKGSRNVLAKQCLILGAPGSGKSTLVERLRSPTGEPGTRAAAPAGKGKEGEGTLDLGLTYEVLDVKDEGDEGDTFARLGLFQLSSPLPPFPSLLSLALSRSTLLDSLVVLVLDWERPWDFVKELEGWIALLEEKLGSQRGAKDEQWEQVEGRERLEALVRSYVEPPAPGATAASTSSSAAAHLDADSPLPPGTLLDNLGVGHVVVCTKADHMNSLEREREFTEEQFDFIQQTLRTVALRYGAAVFYTAQTLPSSFAKLRQYILHRLFAAPATVSSATGNPGPTSSTAPSAASAPSSSRTIQPAASSRASFPFPHRANVIDRDGVLVPAGWDSWGKIKILRERFDCEACGEGWSADLEALNGTQMDGGDDLSKRRGLKKEYEMVVVDFDAEDPAVNVAPTVAARDEQSFLREHYDTLQADAASDPRLAFRQPGAPSSASGLGPSVVGPMAGASLDLPTVASTLERARERGDGSAARDAGRDERFRASMSRQNSSTGASARSPPLGNDRISPSLASNATFADRPTSARPPSASSTGAAAPAGTAGAAAGGNQVLADFFQSLLTARTAGGSAPPPPSAGGSGLGASTSGKGSPAPPAGAKARETGATAARDAAAAETTQK
ncbi:hypothetical protein Rhopal_005078-T1 [Rhodotorula paludigena]|uniref:Dynein light intermediate chain n=1 Tax=Rhodotorula paludigena TaxID=86838 RepID=A0AAV5GQA1_9BASI|nr:hypothetical protein Rhopal_005078-T1 [Rhodotorula paludigena]